MKKRITAFFLAVAMTAVLCLPVAAATGTDAGTPDVMSAEQKQFFDEMVTSVKLRSVWRNIAMSYTNLEESAFTINVGTPYLESDLKLDINILKTLYFHAANKTDSDKLKVSWTTEASPDWSDDKSFIFTVEKSDTAKVYDLVLNGIESFSGVLTALKLEPVGATSGSYEVTELRILPTLKTQMYYKGSVDSVRITDDKQSIKITGTVSSDITEAGGKIKLYQLGIWENGIEGKNAIKEADSAASFEFTISLGDSVYDKFAVTYESGGKVYLLDEIKFIENPEILAETPIKFPKIKVIKGFHTEKNFSDAAALGSRHANLGIQLNASVSRDMSGTEYTYKNKTYYINTAYVKVVDNIVKTLTDSGNVVTAGFIIYKNGKNESTEDLYHPNAAMTGNTIGLNTTTKEGCEMIEALISYYVERYSRPDKKYGRVVNWLMGNEVGSAYAWCDMGADYPVDKFVRDYERAVRILDTTVRRFSGEGKSYICFDALWDRALPTTTTDRYDNRVILDMISAYSKASSDYNWNVAHHAYPQVLAQPQFWKDRGATESVSSDYVNFKNLHILTDYLRMENNKYNGENRRVILTEQGFNCTSDSDRAERIQAAAFAYAYYVCAFDDVIDSFQYYRPVDHEAEAAMAFRTGLRKNVEGTSDDAGEKRLIYDVYKYIDTEKSLEYTSFALEVLGVSSWNELIPNFDASKLAIRKLSENEAKTGSVASPFKTTLLQKMKGDDYTEKELEQGWSKTFYCESMSTDDNGVVRLLLAETVGALSRGITYTFDTPADFSKTPVYNATVEISDKVTKNVRVMLVAVADDDMITASAVVAPGKKTTVSYDLSSFVGIDRITSVRLLFIGEGEETLPVYLAKVHEIAFNGTLKTSTLVIAAAGAAVVIAAAVTAVAVIAKKKKKK
ncbi:MAG: hypothetical protein IJD95_04010 [Clostridia bacterium]|nr:hypothetical protein [Clostridia bacterium]